MTFWESFWTVFWWLFWAYVFIAYLIALISVITDLFRDHELSGWWKAVWIIFLVFLPFLTVLIYVVARGSGMADRQARASQRAQSSTEDYIRNVASTSPAHDIEKAKELLDKGVITAGEYDALKNKALGGKY